MARTDHYRSSDAPAANTIVVAVTAFFQDAEGRLLLIRRTANDLYAIPGGAFKLGETLTQTVHREVMEETAIAVEVTGLIGVYSDPEHVIEFTDGWYGCNETHRHGDPYIATLSWSYWLRPGVLQLQLKEVP